MKNKSNWWQVWNYDFIKLPKDLFRLPWYASLSPLAKTLYGFLLDRTSLSEASGPQWCNEAGEYFVYFPVAEIMERFGCGQDKASGLLKELEQAGLITRTRKNRTQAYQIVVKPFAVGGVNPGSREGKNDAPEPANSQLNKTENQTERMNTEAITPNDRRAVEAEVMENICFSVLAEQIPEDLLRGILDVIVDTLCGSGPTVRISGEDIPRPEVRCRFRALGQMDICYVHDCLKRERYPISSMRGFILAKLYEAHSFSDAYYTAWVAQDATA